MYTRIAVITTALLALALATPRIDAQSAAPWPKQAASAAYQPPQAGCIGMESVAFLGTNTLSEAQTVCRAFNKLPAADRTLGSFVYFSISESDPLTYYKGFCGEAWLAPDVAGRGIVVRLRGQEMAYTGGQVRCTSYYNAEFIVQHEWGHVADAATANPASPSGRFRSYRADCGPSLSSRPTIAFPDPTGFQNQCGEAWANRYASFDGRWSGR